MLDRFQIIHTSDDGFLSLGSMVMMEELIKQKLDYISIFPLRNVSGMGGAIGPLNITREKICQINENCYVLDTTVVGCIRWALKGGITLKSNTIVLSGINKGLNLLLDLPASGTVMSSLYAASRGCIGVGISCDSKDNYFKNYVLASKLCLDFIREINVYQPQLWSINIPANTSGDSWNIVDTPEKETKLILDNQITIRKLGWTFKV